MGNWLNLLIIIVAIGGPALGAVWKKLEEAAEKRRLEQEIQRRRDEALRTGRPLTDASSRPEAADRPKPELDLAAQRRARLEELRRRQQERLRQAAMARQTRRQGGQVRMPTQQVPPSPGPRLQQRPPIPPISPRPRTPAPTQPRTRPSARSAPGQASTQAPAPRAPSRARSRTADREQPARQGTMSRSPRQARRESRTAPVESMDLQAQDSPVRPQLRVRETLGRITVRDLRRAVIMKEILDPPIALRDEDPFS